MAMRALEVEVAPQPHLLHPDNIIPFPGNFRVVNLEPQLVSIQRVTPNTLAASLHNVFGGRTPEDFEPFRPGLWVVNDGKTSLKELPELEHHPHSVKLEPPSLIQTIMKPYNIARAGLGVLATFLPGYGALSTAAHAQELPDQGNELNIGAVPSLKQVLADQGVNLADVAGVTATDAPENSLIALTDLSPSFLPYDALSEVNSREAPKYFDGGETPNPYYKPEVKFVNGMGFVATDNLRITHIYDENSGNWNELEKYIPLGTAQERINKSLTALLASTSSDAHNPILNPAGLDPDEVNWYLTHGNDIGLKSFQILLNARGEPAFILVTGGAYGINKPENIQAAREAVRRLNQVDPNIIDIITIQQGLRVLGGEMPPEDFNFHKGSGASFDARLGLERINEITQPPTSYAGMMFYLLTEPRHIYDTRHLEIVSYRFVFLSGYRLDDIPGIDKTLFCIKWAETNNNKLSQQEYDIIVKSANKTMKSYQENPGI